jgi:hypothetical protein
MYFPQTYHHVQEIQKYNIQDYRPRYVTKILIIYLRSCTTKTTPYQHHFIEVGAVTDILSAEWNNSKRQSAKCGRSSACGNKEVTHSRKQTNRKRAYSKRTILRGPEDAMEKWQARDLVMVQLLLVEITHSMTVTLPVAGQQDQEQRFEKILF